MDVTVVVPIRSFVSAKGRLGTRLDASSRRRLMRALASHTTDTVASAGLRLRVATGDEEVADWAAGRTWEVVADTGGGLDAAALAGVEAVDGPWLVLHADLPLLTASDLHSLRDGLGRSSAVLAPSSDGGTSAIGGHRVPTRFRFGVSSFHRHRAMAPDAMVVTRTGLLLDVDDPDDLDAALSHPRGMWLEDVLSADIETDLPQSPPGDR